MNPQNYHQSFHILSHGIIVWQYSIHWEPQVLWSPRKHCMQNWWSEYSSLIVSENYGSTQYKNVKRREISLMVFWGCLHSQKACAPQWKRQFSLGGVLPSPERQPNWEWTCPNKCQVSIPVWSNQRTSIITNSHFILMLDSQVLLDILLIKWKLSGSNYITVQMMWTMIQDEAGLPQTEVLSYFNPNPPSFEAFS